MEFHKELLSALTELSETHKSYKALVTAAAESLTKRFLLSQQEIRRHVSNVCEDGTLGQDFEVSREEYYKTLYTRSCRVRENKSEVNILYCYLCSIF